MKKLLLLLSLTAGIQLLHASKSSEGYASDEEIANLKDLFEKGGLFLPSDLHPAVRNVIQAAAKVKPTDDLASDSYQRYINNIEIANNVRDEMTPEEQEILDGHQKRVLSKINEFLDKSSTIKPLEDKADKIESSRRAFAQSSLQSRQNRDDKRYEALSKLPFEKMTPNELNEFTDLSYSKATSIKPLEDRSYLFNYDEKAFYPKPTPIVKQENRYDQTDQREEQTMASRHNSEDESDMASSEYSGE